MRKTLHNFYNNIIVAHPILLLLTMLLLVFFLSFYIPKFELDASSDTLVVENDPVLKYYREIKERYGSDDYLVLTYSPHQDLFSTESIADLQKLSDELKLLERVDSVTTMLNVPLIESPAMSLSDLSKGINTISNGKADIELAKKELLNSPLYENLLMSKDSSMAAVLVTFKQDSAHIDLLKRKSKLYNKKLSGNITPQELSELSNITKTTKANNNQERDQQKEDIAEIREIISRHKDNADLHLGGVPMIVADSIEFINKDLRVFGIVVASFLVLLLSIIFRQVRWVVLPMITCVCVGVSMVGLLGFIGWPVTVVSSNFISLLLIITLSMTVHLIVRYREIQSENPKASEKFLITEMVGKMAAPCFFTSITTLVAFGSLVVSGIRPVIDFGWMMAMGISISFILVFTIFPALLSLLTVCKNSSLYDFTNKITHSFAIFIKRNKSLTLSMFLVLSILSIIGITKLTVENRFIDYYKESTEIYRGMEAIDKKLGGTTPLEIIIDAPKDFIDNVYENDPNITGSRTISDGYWFNGFMLEDIEEIHNYLDSLPETGKVLSFHTAMKMLKQLDKESVIDSFYLSVLYKKIPADLKKQLIDPYISKDGNQLRFSLRIFESDHSLNRQELLNKIRSHLVDNLGYKPEQVHITGMLALYNNMLQSLFTSQIMTIGFVFIAILIMFIFSFRNFYMAIIAIIPNIIAATTVLGIMGWLSIPLDIMTITIAAICIGIAVDDTIHYVHRFTSEFKKDSNYWAAVIRSHKTIGKAMYYTSITITLGFSTLAFSNFIPTIYFGILTAFSMVIALIADLTLLPLLIILFKPLGKEKNL